jgi:hypothetical protein
MHSRHLPGTSKSGVWSGMHGEDPLNHMIAARRDAPLHSQHGSAVAHTLLAPLPFPEVSAYNERLHRMTHTPPSSAAGKSWLVDVVKPLPVRRPSFHITLMTAKKDLWVGQSLPPDESWPGCMKHGSHAAQHALVMHHAPG